MKNMGTIPVDLNVLHGLRIYIAGNMAAPFQNQYRFACRLCLLGKNCTEKAGTDDQIIILHLFSPAWESFPHYSVFFSELHPFFAMFKKY